MTSGTRPSGDCTTGYGMITATFDVEHSSITCTCQENSHLALSSACKLAKARQRFRIGVAAAASLRHVHPCAILSIPFWQQGDACQVKSA